MRKRHWLVGGLLTSGVIVVVITGLLYRPLNMSTEFKPEPDDIGRIIGSIDTLIVESGGIGEWPGEGDTIGSAKQERDKNGNIVLTHELVGFSDDSVKGERNRWVLEELDNGQYKVINKGSQFKCWRGRGADEWRSRPLCP